MNTSNNKPLEALYETAKKELYTEPIRSLGILAGIFAVLIPLLLSGSLRDFFLYQSELLLQKKVTMSILPLLLGSLSLLCSLYILHKPHKKFKVKYLFHSYCGYTWRFCYDKSGNIKFSDGTYCEYHKIKYTEVDMLLICPFCGSKDALKIDTEVESTARDMAKSIIDAIKNNHITCDTK